MKQQSPSFTKDAILNFIKSQLIPPTRREIAKAFNIKDQTRIRLKALLKELEQDGLIKYASGCYRHTDTPHHAAVDRAEISRDTRRLVGRFEKTARGGWFIPANRKIREVFAVASASLDKVKDGDIVVTEIDRAGQARISQVIGAMDDPKAVTLIAIHELEIPHQFSPEAEKLAAKAQLPALKDREDLREITLVTIDDEDARDFDDAVWAEADGHLENPGGWHAVVAIADVAYYVRPNDALDQTAFERGNSVYFADRVVPMLPEALSNEMCSLKPDVDRGCLAVHLWFDKDGNPLRHRFVRGIMRSTARLTYRQVQNARDGELCDLTDAFIKRIITPLYGVFQALMKARKVRGTLDLDLPERRIFLDEAGNIKDVRLRPRFDSHRLIEELMIAANVAAAVTLEKKQLPCMYRIHDRPDPVKVASLANFLTGISIKFPKSSNIEAQTLSNLCKKVSETPFVNVVNELVLRTQSQAEYNPVNIGHFGLGLTHYCHFTSPIRRYSDILVHRALISGFKFGEDGLEPEARQRFAGTGVHISATERRAAQAERITVDRFIAFYMQKHVGEDFKCRISGVTNFGLFVTLDASGATGLVPIRTLPEDYYHFDEKHHQLTGRRNHLAFRLGDTVVVKLDKVEPVTGGLAFSMAKPDKAPRKKPAIKSPKAKKKPQKPRKSAKKARAVVT